MAKYKLLIFLLLPIGFTLVQVKYPWDKSIEGICTKVSDGDTIWVSRKKIRLVGIDAPEIEQMSFDKVPIGKMSKKYLAKLILLKKVRVVSTGNDRYNRILGEVFLEDENINHLMLKEGMAVVYGRSPDKKLLYMQTSARLKQKGIFATSGFKHPYEYRRSRRRSK